MCPLTQELLPLAFSRLLNNKCCGRHVLLQRSSQAHRKMACRMALKSKSRIIHLLKAETDLMNSNKMSKSEHMCSNSNKVTLLFPKSSVRTTNLSENNGGKHIQRQIKLNTQK